MLKTQGSMVDIPPVRLPDGSLSPQHSIDLSPFQTGSVTRLCVDETGELRINPVSDVWWQVGEVRLPPPEIIEEQIGVETVEGVEVVTVERAAGTVDAVEVSSAQRLGRVGPAWRPYLAGSDYGADAGAITWLDGGRRPAPGDLYQVEVISSSEQPIMRQRQAPLDLAAHKVIEFSAPLPAVKE